MYMQGDFESSLGKFKFLLNNSISNNLADNCQFWIGQIFFSKNDYENAINEFSNVLKYENSNKKVDAIYKMGLCYLKLNNNTEAVKLFQKIIDNYPKTEYYNKAYEFILSIK